MPETTGRVLGLVEVPEGLRRLKATVREIRMHCFALTNVPEWLAELKNLQLLHLDGEWSREIWNGALIQLPEALGSLHCLQSLTLMNFESLRTLPSSIVTLTSLETLHTENCWGFEELPMMAVMTALRSLTLCDSLERLLASMWELNLRYLMLGHVKHVDTLPGICARLTSLETLSIAACDTMQELPALSLMTSLTLLALCECPLIKLLSCVKSLTAMRQLSLGYLINFTRLPCLGGMSMLQHLSLYNLGCLVELPSSISLLTNLRLLTLDHCDGITDLPSMCKMWSLEVLRICYCYALQNLPPRMDALTALRTLELTYLENHENGESLSSDILEHTSLTELTLTEIWLADASFVESMTSLRKLTICVQVAGILTLACALPALRLLQYLELNTGMSSKDEIINICRSLKAWPLPFLLDLDCYQDIGEICCQALMLPPQSAGWTNAAVPQHWPLQQYKVLAFGGGMHWRLGTASLMSSLSDTVFVLIADEVLDGFGQLGRWQLD